MLIKPIIGHINIKSISSKFDRLNELVLKRVKILVVSETKLCKPFLNSQFYIDSFSMSYR